MKSERMPGSWIDIKYPMSVIRRLNKELTETIDAANQVYSVAAEPGNLYVWNGFIFGPTGTPYEGGIFKIHIEFPKDYPFNPPKITFKTKIYHPNISSNGYICLDILKDKWSPILKISQVLLSLSSLLSDPNPNDPLAPDVADLYITDRAKFTRIATRMTKTFAILTD
jgi:ubiquitin-conjugating enzyme E2 D/E